MIWNRIILEPSELITLQSLIEVADNTNFQYTRNFGNIMYLAENEITELYLKSSPHKYLIISRLSLMNQRIGTGTKIVNFLKDFAKEKGFIALVIESTLTPEMNRFSLKHGFKPIQNEGIIIDNEFFGNYLVKL